MQKKIQKYLTIKFQNEGITPSSLLQLAGELPAERKSLLSTFDNTDALIDKTIMEMLNNAYVKVINIIAAKSPFIEKFYSIYDIVKTNLNAFDDSSLAVLKKHYPATWIKAARFRKYNIIPLLRLLINAGIKKGVLNNYPEELYLKLVYGAVTEITKTKSKNIHEELDMLLQIVLNGALTKKGKKFLNYKLVNVH